MAASPAPVDLRSDTVTRPTAAMRRAMAEAEVGDDVFGDDPTVQALERRVAELAGKEAALYVPSGTMGNQLAVACQCGPGDEVLLQRESHIFLYEQGGVAANAGALAHVVAGESGVIAPETLIAAIRPEDDHAARLRLVCVENTHNRMGGAIVPLERLRALAAAARERSVRVHLDGARLWNASVASGVPIREWAATADTVMMCFSKGLGAPIGSILVGTGALIRDARRLRKRWGGGMRQVGILAAACLHAVLAIALQPFARLAIACKKSVEWFRMREVQPAAPGQQKLAGGGRHLVMNGDGASGPRQNLRRHQPRGACAVN